MNELIDPCNVLLAMTFEGQLGFGHLRYQEFLAAEETNLNRAVDIRPLLSIPWWRAVFVLYSQRIDSLDWLLEALAGDLLPRACQPTVDAMIQARPRAARAGLRRSLKAVYSPELSFRDELLSEGWDEPI